MKVTLKLILVSLILSSLWQPAVAQNFELLTFPISNNTIADLCADNGGVWAATPTGAARLINGEWVHYDASNNLTIDSVKQIIKDDQGTVWFLGQTGVARLKNENWTYSHGGLAEYGGLLDYTPGNVWFKFRTDELLKISSTDTTVVSPEYSFVDGVEQDPSGQYWAFNVDCIFYLHDNVWQGDTCLAPIRDFHIDKFGNQWVAGGDGIIYYRAANTLNFEPQEIPFDAPAFTSINSDQDGNVYFGTWSQGLIIKTLSDWISLDAGSGLLSNLVHDIEVDNQDNVWISVSDWTTNGSGVHVIQKNDGGINRIRGVIYADVNNDGVQNENESQIPNVLVNITNTSSYYSITNSQGEFSFAPAIGENTITVLLKDFWEEGENPITYTFTYPDENPEFSIGLKWKEVHDAAVSLNANAARPGFNTNYYIQVRNEGSVTENIEVTLHYDPALAFISSNEAPTSSSTGQMIFNFSDVKAQHSKTIELMFNLPPSVALGTILTSQTTITSLVGETELTDNIDSVKVTVTGSFDPNDKLVKEGILEEGYVELGKPLTYTIRFQNTGTDYAFNIKILDTLDPHFDLTTLEVLGASHTLTYSLDNRTLKFIFNDIMLPDSTNNEPESHGYVTYRIKPLTATLNNTVVLNSAAIYFDFNEPVITNEVSNLLVTELPSDEVLRTEDQFLKSVFYPNPATNQTLHLKDEARQFHSADLISLNGVSLQHFNLLENPNVLKLNTVPAGIYLLKFANHQKIMVARLVITE